MQIPSFLLGRLKINYFRIKKIFLKQSQKKNLTSISIK